MLKAAIQIRLTESVYKVNKDNTWFYVLYGNDFYRNLTVSSISDINHYAKI
jgi:hypothetical protein